MQHNNKYPNSSVYILFQENKKTSLIINLKDDHPPFFADFNLSSLDERSVDILEKVIKQKIEVADYQIHEDVFHWLCFDDKERITKKRSLKISFVVDGKLELLTFYPPENISSN
jgi:hypothetical protein